MFRTFLYTLYTFFTHIVRPNNAATLVIIITNYLLIGNQLVEERERESESFCLQKHNHSPNLLKWNSIEFLMINWFESSLPVKRISNLTAAFVWFKLSIRLSYIKSRVWLGIYIPGVYIQYSLMHLMLVDH